MATRVLLVDGDLLALSRVESATRAAGAELDTCAAGELQTTLAASSFDLVIVDLDRGGRGALDALAAARKDSAPGRVIAFYSHVDEDSRSAAESAGIEAWPRGRLWRSLQDLLKR